MMAQIETDYKKLEKIANDLELYLHGSNGFYVKANELRDVMVDISKVWTDSAAKASLAALGKELKVLNEYLEVLNKHQKLLKDAATEYRVANDAIEEKVNSLR